MTMEFTIRTELRRLREERRARRYAWTSRQKECTTPRITVPNGTSNVTSRVLGLIRSRFMSTSLQVTSTHYESRTIHNHKGAYKREACERRAEGCIENRHLRTFANKGLSPRLSHLAAELNPVHLQSRRVHPSLHLQSSPCACSCPPPASPPRPRRPPRSLPCASHRPGPSR